MKRKIVILHPAYWRQAFGGAEQQIKFLVKYLHEKDWEVHLIFENQKTLEDNTFVILHPLRKIPLKKTFGNRWFLYKREIFRILETIEPDVIYTRFYSSWSGFAAIFSNQRKIIHIWAIASDNDVVKPKIPFYKPLDYIERIYINSGFLNATHFITQNHFQQELLLKNYSRKSRLLSQASRKCHEEAIQKNTDGIRVIWVGNLKQVKQPELFLKLAWSFKDMSEIKFTMIGRFSSKYEKLIEKSKKNNKNFEYLGELPNAKVNEILCTSHILINTSKLEGFSNTFVEAWHRKVVVISMNSNPDNILTEKGIGWLLPSINLMKIKLIELMDNKLCLYTMGEKAYHYSHNYHSIEKNLTELEQLLYDSN